MIGAIWAHAHGILGNDGTMPWYLPEDLAHFKQVTSGSAVLMGHATWRSLPEQNRPLPGRDNYVASRLHTVTGATMVRDIDAFLRDPRWQRDDLWIIGGAQIYRATASAVQRVAITEIDLHVLGDTPAPPSPEPLECGAWQTSRTGLRYRFCHWQERQC